MKAIWTFQNVMWNEGYCCRMSYTKMCFSPRWTRNGQIFSITILIWTAFTDKQLYSFTSYFSFFLLLEIPLLWCSQFSALDLGCQCLIMNTKWSYSVSNDWRNLTSYWFYITLSASLVHKGKVFYRLFSTSFRLASTVICRSLGFFSTSSTIFWQPHLSEIIHMLFLFRQSWLILSRTIFALCSVQYYTLCWSFTSLKHVTSYDLVSSLKPVISSSFSVMPAPRPNIAADSRLFLVLAAFAFLSSYVNVLCNKCVYAIREQYF